jgi:acyl-CoA thioesterase-1
MIVGVATVVLLVSCRHGGTSARVAADSACGAANGAAGDSGACSHPAENGTAGSTASPRSPTPNAGTEAIAPGPGTPNPGPLRIVFLGTSLTAGYGLDPADAYPALIQRRLDSLRLPWRAVNAGVSGETSAGALRRLDWTLKDPAAILVVETGANDGLRGLDLDATRANLEAIIRRARVLQPGLRIVLAGMEMLPNLGPRYAAEFRELFPDVAAREKVALIPFLLRGVGGVDSLNQADGIHPNAAGERIVARNVWRVLAPMVQGRGGP